MINIFPHDWDWAFTIWTSSCYWICLEHEIWTFSGKVDSWLPRGWSSYWGHISTSRISTGTSHPNPCSLEIRVEYNEPTAYTFASRVFRWNFLRPTSASPWKSISILIRILIRSWPKHWAWALRFVFRVNGSIDSECWTSTAQKTARNNNTGWTPSTTTNT